ncbi:Putative Ig domain-containing protein [Deinococcus reticulitermitis]|uniref:Putative Ig domain-containing protein n=1 Tax=Deinococcus reticulitermitis TaxID=856736 RepID=A0A1H6RWC9_9DEIO|nr:Putative Ig domain-containing protein [Deinococcus reticulitermitis]
MTPGLRRWGGAALLGAALLGGCGSVTTGNDSLSGTSGTSRADVMTFQNTSLPVGYVGESYSGSVAVTGGVGSYGYRVSAGRLPPGLRLSGSTLSGTPTQVGSFAFSVEATDANLSTRVQAYTVNVETLPPLSLQPTLPPSAIRGETRIPLTIKAPRNVRAARLSWDLGENVQVTRVQAGAPDSVLFWRQQGRVLTLDLGFRTVPKSDARVALITVRPTQAVTLNTNALGYDARDGSGKLIAEKKLPVTEKAAPAKTGATPAPAPAAPTPAPPSGAARPAEGPPLPPATPASSGTPAPGDAGTPPAPAPSEGGGK